MNNKLKYLYRSRVLYKNRYNQKNFTSLARIFAYNLLSIIANIIYDQKLTAVQTYHMFFDIKLIISFDLRDKDFDFCQELTAQFSKIDFKFQK